MSVFVPEGTPAFPFRIQPRLGEASQIQFGRIVGEPIECYHAAPCLSKSKLDSFFHSPRYFQGRYLTGEYEDEQTEALLIGSALDALAIEGEEEFKRRFCVVPDDAPRKPTKKQRESPKPTPAAKASMAFWDNWNEANRGKDSLDSDQYALVQRMAEKVNSNREFAEFKRAADKQITYRLRGDKFAVQCRPDMICEAGCEITKGIPTIFDLKKIRELPVDDPEMIRRHIQEFGYHRAAYMYREIVSLVNKWGDFRPRFVLALQESQDPYATWIREVDAISIECAEVETREAMQRLEQCIMKNEWPESWEEPFAPIGVTDWHVRRVLSRTDVRTI